MSVKFMIENGDLHSRLAQFQHPRNKLTAQDKLSHWVVTLGVAIAAPVSPRIHFSAGA